MAEIDKILARTLGMCGRPSCFLDDKFNRRSNTRPCNTNVDSRGLERIAGPPAQGKRSRFPANFRARKTAFYDAGII
jgi:hypothetical protein